MKQQLIDIIDNGKQEAILPFLTQLSEKQKKELIPTIKQKFKSFDKIVEVAPNTYGSIATSEQWYIIKACIYFCFDRQTFMKGRYWLFRNTDTYEELFPLYIPEWFPDFFNNAEHIYISYSKLMEWIAKSYITSPSPEYIAERLVNEMGKSTDLSLFDRYPVALSEHIWYIFEYTTSINWGSSERCISIIQQLCEDKRTDRLRVLRESLLAQNHNFNKNLTNWFSAFFLRLQPTEKELILLQDELLSTLTCVQSKPVNSTLGIIKKLLTVPGFKTEEFLTYIPNLVSAETKSIITATLGILQQLLKTGAVNPHEILLQLTHVFICKDENIQKKAAALFIRYATPGKELSDALETFEENILRSVKTQLAAWLPQTNAQPSVSPSLPVSQPEEKASIIREENKIVYPETYEDFIFFLNQAVSLPEPYFLDLAFAQLIRWTDEAPADKYELQDTAMKKICKQSHKWEPLHHLLANLLNEYTLNLECKNPGQAQKLLAPWQKLSLGPVNSLDLPAYYKGFREIAIAAKKKLQTSDPLPLLSTPTHLPIWIDPVVLVERVIRYQQVNAEPDNMDMQLAIQRCALDDTKEALLLVEKELTGELKDLFSFLLAKGTAPKGAYNHPAWWITAAITRSPGQTFPEFGKFEYSQIPAEQLSGDYVWEPHIKNDIDYNDKPTSYPALNLKTPPYKLRKGSPLFIEYLLLITEQGEYHSTEFMEYEFANFAKENLPYLLYSLPNNITPLLGVLAWELAETTYWEVPEKKMAITSMECFYQLRQMPLNNSCYLYLGSNMLNCPDKTVANYAVQIWAEKVKEQAIDNTQLGNTIGKIEYYEFHPLKRFTDLIYESMWNISPQHNQALLEIIEGILAESNPTPIKNIKKLLEIYIELLAITGNKPGPATQPILQQWQATSLKKIVAPLLQ